MRFCWALWRIPRLGKFRYLASKLGHFCLQRLKSRRKLLFTCVVSVFSALCVLVFSVNRFTKFGEVYLIVCRPMRSSGHRRTRIYLYMTSAWLFYPTEGREVLRSACLSVRHRVSQKPRPIFTKFSVGLNDLWPLIGHFLNAVGYAFNLRFCV